MCLLFIIEGVILKLSGYNYYFSIICCIESVVLHNALFYVYSICYRLQISIELYCLSKPLKNGIKKFNIVH